MLLYFQVKGGPNGPAEVKQKHRRSTRGHGGVINGLTNLEAKARCLQV